MKEARHMYNEVVIKKEPIFVIGIDCRTSNAPEAGPKDIPKVWGRFFQENTADKIPNKTSKDIIALYCDYEGDFIKPYTFVLGCPVSSLRDIPKGMVGKTIPASTYVCYHVKGDYPKSLIDTWGMIWTTTDLKRTYTGDYEIYYGGSHETLDVLVAI